MDYSTLHKLCIERGYYIEILTGRSFVKVTVYYGNACDEMGAEDEFQRLCHGTDKGDKPSVNAAAKKAATMLKMVEGSKRAKWWETEYKKPQMRPPSTVRPREPVRGTIGERDLPSSFHEDNYWDELYRYNEGTE